MMLQVEWPLIFDSCRDCSALDEVEDRTVYERLAVNFLDRWTEHQFGLRTVRYRPTGPQCFGTSTFEGRGPFTTQSLGYRPERPADRKALPLRQPQEVVSVTVDGEILEPSAYVLEGETLYRIDGGVWPLRQDLDRPTTEEGTFEVEYLRGLPVPEGGQVSAGLLACEFAKAACGDADCQLPERVQTVTRQGVTVAVMDQFEDLEKGHTGIWIVDSWVASVTAPTRPSKVLSPDRLRRRK